MTVVKQVLIGSGTPSDIGAKYDDTGVNEIRSTYAHSIQLTGNNTLQLKNNASTSAAIGNSVTIQNATYSTPGLMDSYDKIKLDAFFEANEYATTTYVNDLVAANDAMEYKGTVDSDSELPLAPQNGWAYKVSTAGLYTLEYGEDPELCQIGDILLYNSGSGKWEKISSSIEGTLYKTSPFVDGQMLISNGTQGAVTTRAIAPSVALTAANSSDAQTILITVGGFTSSASSQLDKATTNKYGVTKLTSATNLTTDETLATTPKGVNDTITARLAGIQAAPLTEIYTLLPEDSLESTGTGIFRWNGNSITIQNNNITANSYEVVTIPPATYTTAAEISALNTAMLVDGGQTAGSFTLTALGPVPEIVTHIRVSHKYSTNDITMAATTAAAQAQNAEGWANQAASSVHGIKKKTFTVTSGSDPLNNRYPYTAQVSLPGVAVGDWVDGAGITDQDWALEAIANYVVLHFSKAVSNASITVYWASCQDFDDYQVALQAQQQS